MPAIRLYPEGETESQEYYAWVSMTTRCSDPTNPNYGGRGITVCQLWNSYEYFLECMGRKPSHEMMLDRIDNNGNYEPGNCRWATPAESARNKRDNRKITYNEETLCIAAWAEKLEIPYFTLYSRFEYGWSIEQAFTKEHTSTAVTRKKEALDLVAKLINENPGIYAKELSEITGLGIPWINVLIPELRKEGRISAIDRRKFKRMKK